MNWIVGGGMPFARSNGREGGGRQERSGFKCYEVVTVWRTVDSFVN